MAIVKPPKKLTINEMELVVKRSVVRDPRWAGLEKGFSFKQTYSGGLGTPRDHTDLDCES